MISGGIEVNLTRNLRKSLIIFLVNLCKFKFGRIYNKKELLNWSYIFIRVICVSYDIIVYSLQKEKNLKSIALNRKQH